MKSRIAVLLTAVALVGGTAGALALAGNSAGGQSAAAGQYCASSCTTMTTTTTTSTTTSTPTPTPNPTPPPPKNLRWSSHTLRPGHPIQVDFRLTKSGTVVVKLLRTVHGKTIVVGTITITFTKSGQHFFKLTTRFAGHKLGNGSYTLSFQTGKGKHISKAVKTKLTVR